MSDPLERAMDRASQARANEQLATLRGEIERLTKENEQLGDRWNDISYERNDLRAEVERLTGERDEWKAKWMSLAQASLIAGTMSLGE
jgi:FtsZ-binding cell division protein ZapB